VSLLNQLARKGQEREEVELDFGSIFRERPRDGTVPGRLGLLFISLPVGEAGCRGPAAPGRLL
jgi:hypothetical protein